LAKITRAKYRIIRRYNFANASNTAAFNDNNNIYNNNNSNNNNSNNNINPTTIRA
jgi:hypothetical protein